MTPKQERVAVGRLQQPKTIYKIGQQWIGISDGSLYGILGVAHHGEDKVLILHQRIRGPELIIATELSEFQKNYVPTGNE